MKKKVALIAGTRPEIIKIAPIYLEQSSNIDFEVIATGQHSDMATQAFDIFGIAPKINLNLMKENQSPLSLISSCVKELENVFSNNNYAGVIVQGDTSSALAGALAAFHFKIPVAHLEAGLRTNNKYSPFPEEMNRCLISRIADIHFCPTIKSKKNLELEGYSENIYITGNSVVDAVNIMRKKVASNEIPINQSIIVMSNKFPSIIFVTGHRRENFGLLEENLSKALIEIRNQNPNTAIIFPVHPNPNVKEPVFNALNKQQRIFLSSHLDYASTLCLMSIADLIITDSGGIQEEAPCFGTPVIVTRELTERSEALEAGYAKLCPLDQPEVIIEEANKIIQNKSKLDSSNNPFGAGDTAQQVIKILETHW